MTDLENWPEREFLPPNRTAITTPFDGGVEYVRTDLAAPKVKPLEWEELEVWSHVGRPPVQFANFAMWVHNVSDGWTCSNRPEIYTTVEAAKEAARAWFETARAMADAQIAA